MSDSQQSQTSLPTPDKATEPLKYQPQNRVLSTILGIAFALLLIGCVRYVFQIVPHYGSLILFAVIFGVALVRTIKANFIDVQSRTIEWLAAIFFCGLLMAIGRTFLNQLEVIYYETKTTLMIVLAVLSVAWSFGGAGWGWRLAKRLNETNGRRRLYFIFSAWIAVLGAIGMMMLALGILLAYFNDYETKYFIVAAVGAVLIPLVMPAYRLDKMAPQLASQRPHALKPVIIDKYARCHFGPQRVSTAMLILHLTGFNLLFLPLIVLKMLKKRSVPECTETQFAQLPAPVAEFVNEYHEPLRELGYSRTFYYRAAVKNGNLVTFGVTYAHPQLGQSCSITAVYLLTHQGATVYRCAIDFFSCFEDETTVWTGNSSELTFIQLENANPKVLAMRFPEVDDPVLLHRLHCARLKKLGRPETAILHESARSIAGLQSDVDKRMDAERKLKLSLPAVYWGTWSIVWPWSLIRLHRLRKRARAQMAELGFDPDVA